MLLAARLLVQPGDPPRSNSRDMEKFCGLLIKSIWDPGNAEHLLGEAASIVNAAAAGNFHRDQIRTQPFTEKVKQMCADRTGGAQK